MDYSAGLKTVMNLSENDNLEISYGFDLYDKARYVNDERTHDHDYTNRQNTVRALYSHIFGKNTLTVGADFLNDYLTTYQLRIMNQRIRIHVMPSPSSITILCSG